MSLTIWLRSGWSSSPADRLGERAAWGTSWSMWSKQLSPYSAVRPGDLICMVERVRGVRTVTEIVQARRVLAEEFGSRRDAAVQVCRLTRGALKVRDVAALPYVEAGPERGFLLAVTGPRLDRLDEPLQDGWFQDRCGWTVAPLHVAQLLPWLAGRPLSRGAGS